MSVTDDIVEEIAAHCRDHREGFDWHQYLRTKLLRAALEGRGNEFLDELDKVEEKLKAKGVTVEA